MTVQRKKKLITEQMYANLENEVMSKSKVKALLIEASDASIKVRANLYLAAISGKYKALGYNSVDEMFKCTLTNMSIKEAHKQVARGKVEVVILKGDISQLGHHKSSQLDAFYSGGHLNKSTDFGCFVENVNSILGEARRIKKELGDNKLSAKHVKKSVARIFSAEDDSRAIKKEPSEAKQQKNEAAIDAVSNLSKEVTSIKTLKKLRTIFTNRIKELESIKL